MAGPETNGQRKSCIRAHFLRLRFMRLRIGVASGGIAKWCDKCSTNGGGYPIMVAPSERNNSPMIPIPQTCQVWLVEDSEADEFLMREALKLEGLNCEFQVSKDGEKAMSAIEAIDGGSQPQPDVVLLDLNLPRKGGARVLERIRRSRNCAHVPVVIVTSSDSPTDKAQVSFLGATRYFQKPLDLAEFMKLGPLVRDMLSGESPTSQMAAMPN